MTRCRQSPQCQVASLIRLIHCINWSLVDFSGLIPVVFNLEDRSVLLYDRPSHDRQSRIGDAVQENPMVISSLCYSRVRPENDERGINSHERTPDAIFSMPECPNGICLPDRENLKKRGRRRVDILNLTT